MPVFNGAAHMKDACRTVLEQTLADLELLIVDDGSSDGSANTAREIAERDERVRVIARETNSGLPAIPRNAGIREARGRYVAFIDHDDTWFARKLERQVGVLEAEPGIGMVHSYLWGIAGHNPLSGLRELCPPAEKATTFSSLHEGNQVQMSSVAIRREILNDLGGFSEDIELRAVEDFEMWLRVSEAHRIDYICEVHGLYRIRSESISRATNHRERLAYLDERRGTRFLQPRGRRSARMARRMAVTPVALWTHLADGSVRYWTRMRPRPA